MASDGGRGGAGAVPVRLRLSRAKGFDLQAHSRATNGLDAVNCARPGRYGNPYREDEPTFSPTTFRRTGTLGRAGAVRMFEKHWCTPLHSAEIARLRGLNLACWCPLPAEGEPDCCHAAVLLRFANGNALAGRGERGGDAGR